MVDHFITPWVFILVAVLYWRAARAGGADGGERRLTVGIAAVAMIAGAWVLEGALLPRWRERAARDWEETTGTVVYSQVTTTTPGSRTRGWKNRYANVGTELVAGGVPDTAWRVGLTRGVGSSEAADSVVARYPVGARVRVYYDPDRPWEAVLEREAPPMSLTRLALGVGLTAGALTLLVLGRERARALPA